MEIFSRYTYVISHVNGKVPPRPLSIVRLETGLLRNNQQQYSARFSFTHKTGVELSKTDVFFSL